MNKSIKKKRKEGNTKTDVLIFFLLNCQTFCIYVYILTWLGTNNNQAVLSKSHKIYWYPIFVMEISLQMSQIISHANFLKEKYC